MAKGIPFPEANLVLRAPTPEDAAAGTVYDLHVHRYRDLDGNPNCISKWQFAPDELTQVVAAGGVFWFHAWGATHPPVGIEGANPFVLAAGADEGQETAAERRKRRSGLSDLDAMADAQAGCAPCKLCGGKAIITDAGSGAGYYVRCENSGAFRAAEGCMVTDRRLGGWAYNVMDWWNRLHAPAALAAQPEAAIIAWLRKLSEAKLTPGIVAFFGDPWGNDGQRLLGEIAAAIERGDHNH